MSPWFAGIGLGLFALSQRQAMTDRVSEDAGMALSRALDRRDYRLRTGTMPVTRDEKPGNVPGHRRRYL